MRRTRVRFALVAACSLAAAVVVTGSLSAHEFTLDGAPLPPGPTPVPNPDPDIHGLRTGEIVVGQKVRLVVANPQGEDCNANIAAVPLMMGASLEIRNLTKASGPVPTREFELIARSPGSAFLNVTVQGVGDGCTEDSVNPIELTVVPQSVALLKAFGRASKSELKILKTGLSAEYATLSGAVRTSLDGFRSDTLAPDDAGHAIYDAWYHAYAGAWFEARQVLQNVSAYASGELFAAGWPECHAPDGLGRGGRGWWDAFRSGVDAQLDGFHAKLDKRIAADIGAFTSIAKTKDIGMSVHYVLTDFPDLYVAGPASGQRLEDPQIPLHIGYMGSLSYSTLFSENSCVAVAGLGDAGFGPVELTLSDTFGGTWTQTVTPEPSGEWDAMFDDLDDGKEYDLVARYLNRDNEGFSRNRVYVGIRGSF